MILMISQEARAKDRQMMVAFQAQNPLILVTKGSLMLIALHVALNNSNNIECFFGYYPDF